MAVALGLKTHSQNVAPIDPNINSVPGEIYRVQMQISQLVPTSDFNKLVEGLIKIKKDFPALSVTYIEVNENTITFEFYDHPVIPIGLLLIAVIAGLVVVGITIISYSVFRLLDLLPEGPGKSALVAFLLVATGVAVAGYGFHKFGGTELVKRAIAR